ncbi:Transforming growth factor-beta-induced protein ig-h3 [Chionoecetes opilio]|uniref:Transforming growth factor-beta-induced protein ig-h3 n=1 Tax=Chionoecetes opilio TaxID=41210 RepID=A0A8J4Y748_CHIOP|nr:Transforming growth factor-beta-induced protein ig-h3 [Chionoecetes opilio]
MQRHLRETERKKRERGRDEKPEIHQGSSRPVPVVPQGVSEWRPPGALTEGERRGVDVVDLLRHLNLTLFSWMVKEADLSFVLELDGPWTVFAPSDEALTTIPRDAFTQIVSRQPFLRRLVSYHLAPGRHVSASFRQNLRLPTLHAGHGLMMSYYTDGPAAQRWVAGGSVVTALDQRASNGVVHVLDRVLYPPYGDLPTTLSLSPILTGFTSLLSHRPDVLSLLSGPGPLTLFVPSDAAMYNTSLPNDPDDLDAAWIRAHVVEGAWYSSGFSNTWPLVSLGNHTLATHVSTNQDKSTVNDVLITYADITASNGVLHVLQSPLFTPT